MGNENLPVKGAEFEYTPEMVEEMEKCKKDIVHFAENYFYILNIDEGRQTIKLHDAQKRVLKGMVDNRFYCLLASRQIGKALSVDTPIKTPKGWTTMGELKPGDQVYGIDGKPCNVKIVYDTQYNKKCFEVEFDNGEKIIADEEHDWFTQSKNERKRKVVCEGSVKNTQELFDTLKSKAGEPNHRIPSCVNGLDNGEKDLPIHPYILGLWLGDGATDGPRITVGERDIEETLKNLEECNNRYTITHKLHKSTYLVNLGMVSGRYGSRKEICLSKELKEHSLMGNKHIPSEYLLGSRDQRLELLKGLMDSDGYIDKKGLGIFYNTNTDLALQVKELIESLGYKTSYSTFIPTLYGKECKECAEITFQPREMVCKLSFKCDRIRVSPVAAPNSKKRNQWHYIKDIREIDSVPVKCIEVDSADQLFLAGKTLIPTHNSTLMTIYLLWLANFFPDQKILLVANKEATAIEIFGRIRMAYEMLPNWLKSPVDGEYGKTSMVMENGSKISITTTTGTAARGQSVSLLVIDECAFIEPHLMEPFWSSVFPIISSSKKAKVFMCSTANGTGNLFHKIYTEAVEGKNGWGHDKVLWSEIPGRDEQWVKEIKGGLASAEKFDQEFNCYFINSGTSSMDEALYDRLTQSLREPVEILMDGRYHIYELPQEDHIYVAGIDTGEGVGGDSSVIKILDITDLSDIIEVAEFCDNQTPVSEFTNICYEILCHWGMPIACIERNNQGGQVCDRLTNDFVYPWVVSWGGKLAGRKNVELTGMVSSRNTKYRAVANARYYYSDRGVVKFSNKFGLEEIFKDFVKVNDTWQAASGKHDDRTMAMIWALMILDKELVDLYFNVEELDDCGKPLRISPIDMGFGDPKNFTSIYTNEQVERIEASNLAPISFGYMDQRGNELSDLRSQGWEFADPYEDPARNISHEHYEILDKYFD